MSDITESSINTTLRQFQQLYLQLNNEKYPITSQTINDSNNRLNDYFKKIITNDINEDLIYELKQLEKLLQLINSPKAQIDDQQLADMIKGRTYRFDHEHNDQARTFFFEADFALRFIHSTKKFQKIDLSYDAIEDECDIVIDDEIIIECKSISSSNHKEALKKHIKHANKQLITRLDNLPNDGAGIIAIDVTQTCQMDWNEVAAKLPIPENINILKFINNPTSDTQLMDIITNEGYSFLDAWLRDNNIDTQLFERLNLSENIYSIMVQSELITYIDIEIANTLTVIPIIGRVMIPYNNPRYQGKIEFPDNFNKSLQHSF